MTEGHAFLTTLPIVNGNAKIGEPPNDTVDMDQTTADTARHQSSTVNGVESGGHMNSRHDPSTALNGARGPLPSNPLPSKALEPAVRILLVDDDEDEYVIVCDLLRSAFMERYELSWAPSYEQGLHAIATSSWDVCLVDYQLGPRSGLDLLAEVTAKPGHPEVILLTGQNDRGVDVTATKAGAADYLVKGEVTGTQLERSIRYAVGRGRTLNALRDAREIAQSLNLAKSAFLAAMSHEIRTPMNAILGMADMLWESPLNSEQMQYVEVFRRAGSGLLLLINDILDLSKIEAGQMEMEDIAFDLEEVIDEAIELIAVKARAKGIVLLSHLSPGVVTSLIGDPTRLRQVLVNLLGNAVKFTESGQVVLKVGNRQAGRLGEIEVTITDTGIGIPIDKLETIFDDFTQADTSTTRKYGGTGLGLSISRRIVEAVGGRLSATSVIGLGSVFSFTAQFKPAGDVARKKVAALGDLCGKRVLLLDDNATNCLILKETLQAWGLDSDAFRSPTDALALLPAAMASELPYSLVIIGSSLGGTGGFEAAARIRQIAADLPTLMLTFDAQPGDASRRAEAGLSGYAIKPVARAHLLRLICDVMAAHLQPEPILAESLDRNPPQSEKPARLLVVEDSPDNRLLIQVYLKGRPYHLTFEEDGRAAVDCFSVSHFDLILMDVQMPVMDGLAATRAIREIERERGVLSTPIVALTANARAQDVQRSAEAGCNAHLSKPISKLQLLSAIEKFRRTTVEMARPKMIRIEMPTDLEDIVPGYLASRRNEIPEMKKMLTDSDFLRLSVAAHNLKGTGGGYGFPALSLMGAALEQSAKRGDREMAAAQVTELADYLDRIELVAKV